MTTRTEHAWIETADGTRLSARIWLPADDQGPVPAILEYLPYRKDDRTAWQDSTRHPYFAEHGYAGVRVDIRGTGDSDGIIEDEYSKQEHDDALDVIAWLAEQPWCSGKVGMIGYSWGGFNGLQVAARRPPALAAVVTLYSTDDRYTDDCHYLGGAVLGADMLRWAQTMRAINALPPRPEVVGDRWREMWRERLERTPNFADAWLSHQRRDDYWRYGSIAEDYSAIQAAVLAVGGWADAYTNAVPRMLEHLQCPRRGIIGPWSHVFPERGIPGPAIGFLQECVAWFDRWLKGADNGVDDWPLLRAWMQEYAAPASFYDQRPGRWLALDGWPPPGGVLELQLAQAGDETPAEEVSDGEPEPAAVRRIRSDQTLGEASGVWCANGMPDEMPLDQSIDDERSLSIDSEPLEGRLELLGFPVAQLELAADRPLAHVIVRLCDVAPDGASTLISYGVLNLAHRDGHDAPSELESGSFYRVEVRLNVIGQAVPAGHRLRLAISPTWWPLVWPAPEQVTLSVRPAGSLLRLPLAPSGSSTHDPQPFGPPEMSEPLERRGTTVVRRRRVERDGDFSRMSENELHDTVLAHDEVRIREEHVGEWSIAHDEPLSAHFTCARDYLLERGDWKVSVRTAAMMSATASVYRIDERLEAFEGDERIFETERWFEVPRDHT